MRLRAVSDFQMDLEFSQKGSDEPFWEAVYRKAFPNMVGHIATNEDSQSQRLGIDRHVHLASGRTLRIDEKKRRTTWPDILLEYVSNDRTGSPGWIEKDLQIDYMAYAFMDTQTVHLFPWDILQRVWWEHKAQLLNLALDPLSPVQKVSAANVGYNTLSIAVPTDRLLVRVKEALTVQL